METIKELLKKAKREERKNPEFLYQLGLRFKTGDGCDKSDKKAAKYFEKAADLGHIQGQIETAIRWWKHWNSYYYANLYLQKAIAQGSREAEQILEEMQETLDDKDNPAFMYRKGVELLNNNTIADITKGTKLLYKSGKLGYEKSKLAYGIYYSKRFYEEQAANWLLELAEKGNEEAKNALAELLKLIESNKVSTLTGELYEEVMPNDNAYTAFLKKHTLICCPACRGRIKCVYYKGEGGLTQTMVTVYDEGSIFERISDPFEELSCSGKTETLKYECDVCKLSFEKTTNIKVESRERENFSKETELWRVATVFYQSTDKKADKDCLRILKNSSGKFEGKY